MKAPIHPMPENSARQTASIKINIADSGRSPYFLTEEILSIYRMEGFVIAIDAPSQDTDLIKSRRFIELFIVI